MSSSISRDMTARLTSPEIASAVQQAAGIPAQDTELRQKRKGRKKRLYSDSL